MLFLSSNLQKIIKNNKNSAGGENGGWGGFSTTFVGHHQPWKKQ